MPARCPLHRALRARGQSEERRTRRELRRRAAAAARLRLRWDLGACSSADCRASGDAWVSRRVRTLGYHLVFGRGAGSIWQVPSRVSHAERLTARCQRSMDVLRLVCKQVLDETSRGVVSNGSALVIGAWPFHGLVAGCAMRSIACIRACVGACFFVAWWSVPCVPLFRILPTSPNITRLASRPREGLEFGYLAVTGRCRLTLRLTTNLNDKGCRTATNIGGVWYA